MNPVNQDGVKEAFIQLITDILRDQERNERSNSMKDDLWDESIKIRTTKTKLANKMNSGEMNSLQKASTQDSVLPGQGGVLSGEGGGE